MALTGEVHVVPEVVAAAVVVARRMFLLVEDPLVRLAWHPRCRGPGIGDSFAGTVISMGKIESCKLKVIKKEKYGACLNLPVKMVQMVVEIGNKRMARFALLWPIRC